MIKVTVIEKGISPERFLGFVKQEFYFEAQGKVVELAEETLAHIRETIKQSKKRPSLGNNLEQTIDIDYIQSVGGVQLGIGRISLLKSDAPYFEVLDVGGYTPPANIGYFTSGSGLSGDKTFPEAGISGQNWVHTGKGSGNFFMKPTKAIEGIDYVGKASRFLADKLKTEFASWMKNKLKESTWDISEVT